MHIFNASCTFLTQQGQHNDLEIQAKSELLFSNLNSSFLLLHAHQVSEAKENTDKDSDLSDRRKIFLKKSIVREMHDLSFDVLHFAFSLRSPTSYSGKCYEFFTMLTICLESISIWK